MSPELAIYLISLIGSLGIFMEFILMAMVFVVVSYAVIGFVEGESKFNEESKKEFFKRYFYLGKRILVVFVIVAIAAVAIPDKKTLYAIFAVKYLNESGLSHKGAEIVNIGADALIKRLKDYDGKHE